MEIHVNSTKSPTQLISETVFQGVCDKMLAICRSQPIKIADE